MSRSMASRISTLGRAVGGVDAGAEAGEVDVGRLARDHDVGLERVEAARHHFPAERGDVVVGAQRRRAEHLPHARAGGAAVRPVQRHAIAQRAAEQLVDRHAQRLGLDVPQRQLDAGHGLVRDAAQVLPRGAQHVPVQALDRPRILADAADGVRSRTQPSTPYGLRLSLHSPQPTRPSSVSMRTKVHGRQPPSQCNASTRAIFMAADHATARQRWQGLQPSQRPAGPCVINAQTWIQSCSSGLGSRLRGNDMVCHPRAGGDPEVLEQPGFLLARDDNGDSGSPWSARQAAGAACAAPSQPSACTRSPRPRG